MSDERGDQPIGDAALDPSPAPRAFVTATGYAYQLVGMIYLLTFGFYWIISGLVQAKAAVPINSVADYFAPGNVLLTVTMVMILSGVAGGLAMVTLGIGLQGERRWSGVGAMIVVGSLAVIGSIGAVLYIMHGPAWGRAVVAGGWSVMNTVLFLLAGNSASILKRNPPPKDQNFVDDAWLERYERERRESRSRR